MSEAELGRLIIEYLKAEVALNNSIEAATRAYNPRVAGEA